MMKTNNQNVAGGGEAAIVGNGIWQKGGVGIVVWAACFVVISQLAVAAEVADYYEVETVRLPATVVPEIGALEFTDEGELVVGLRRGEILIASPAEDPNAFGWRLFNPGVMLHELLGLDVVAEGEMVVSTFPEVTRIRDTTGDGIADRYEVVSADFGLSGNYHEAKMLVPDGEGNWYMAIATASFNGPTFEYLRGEFSPIGRRGRNYSAAPYIGWVVKITREGEVIPWSSGFRSPNGILHDSRKRLWAVDNEGDWIGTSPLYHVRENGHAQHPSSLIWRDDFEEGVDPLKMPIAELEALRTLPAIQMPHGDFANSPTQPVEITEAHGMLAVFSGQFLVGDNAGSRILRIMVEEVGGEYQGACTFFIRGGGLHTGTNRMVISPDGEAVYAGQTIRGWGAQSEHLQRIRMTGEVPMEVLRMSLRADGFDIEFTHPVDREVAMKPEVYGMRHYYYSYHSAYGSPKRDETAVVVEGVSVSEDGRTVSLELGELVAERIYHLDFKGMRSEEGVGLLNPAIAYTLNRLR